MLHASGRWRDLAPFIVAEQVGRRYLPIEPPASNLLDTSMHELSIAQSLVDLLSEQLVDHEHAKVTTVLVRVGELSGVVPAALSSGFAVASQGTALHGARLKIELVAPRIWCDRCAAEQPASSVQNLVCVECGQPSNDVRAGRELDVTHMEIAEETLEEQSDAV